MGTFHVVMGYRAVILVAFLGIFSAIEAEGSLPVVIWHGMGDSCCNPVSMGRIKQIIEGETNGYVLSLKIGYTVIDDTINGFLKPVNQQVEMVCQQIADDPELQNGYNAIGFSQGGQFLRAVAQRCPSPPMKNLVTFGAQHQGVFGFPNCPGEMNFFCDIVRDLLNYGAYVDFVQEILVQAQYWHDPLHFDTYVEKSKFIAEINNEKAEKNETYAVNLASLENFVMVKHNQDGMVEPRESELFEFYTPGQSDVILPLRESPIYVEDRIGLKALDESGRLHFLDVEGDHLQFTRQWFIDNIINVFLGGGQTD